MKVATLDHIILKVNDLDASVEFYTKIMGFSLVGADGPFTVIRSSPDFQLQLAPWGTREKIASKSVAETANA